MESILQKELGILSELVTDWEEYTDDFDYDIDYMDLADVAKNYLWIKINFDEVRIESNELSVGIDLYDSAYDFEDVYLSQEAKVLEDFLKDWSGKQISNFDDFCKEIADRLNLADRKFDALYEKTVLDNWLIEI